FQRPEKDHAVVRDRKAGGGKAVTAVDQPDAKVRLVVPEEEVCLGTFEGEERRLVDAEGDAPYDRVSAGADDPVVLREEANLASLVDQAGERDSDDLLPILVVDVAEAPTDDVLQVLRHPAELHVDLAAAEVLPQGDECVRLERLVNDGWKPLADMDLVMGDEHPVPRLGTQRPGRLVCALRERAPVAKEKRRRALAEPVDEIHAEAIALQGRQHPRLLGDEGKYASDRIPNRRGPDGALSDLKPRIAHIDVAEIPRRLRCCGQVAGCAIESAAELDLERLRAHQQRSHSVSGGEPHPCQLKSSPARSTKIPWATSRTVIVISIAGSPDSFKPPTIVASLASTCRTTRTSAPGTRIATGSRSRYRTTCGTGSGASKSRPSTGCVVQPGITGPPSGRTSSAP